MNESMPVKAILLYEVISGATSKQQLNLKRKSSIKILKLVAVQFTCQQSNLLLKRWKTDSGGSDFKVSSHKGTFNQTEAAVDRREAKNNAVTRKQSWQELSCFQDTRRDREALQTWDSGSGGYLCYCVTQAAMTDGLSVTWTPPILVKMPPHWLVSGMLNPSRGRSQFPTIQLQLQIFSRTRGFEAIQIWWLLLSSWRGWSWELSSSSVCAVCLLSVCPSVDTENRRSSIILWRPQWKLGSHNNYLTLSHSFMEF